MTNNGNLMFELKNDRFLRALMRQPVDVTPVWMMRQAGRYLPEYRASRTKAGSFMDLCTNPELACEVTLQPLDRYPLDAAILFSDILTIPDAMGLGLYFEQGEGPRFQKSLSSAADIEALPVVNTQKDLPYVLDAVRTIRRELNGRVPLIGFSGSPWTLATYMLEGGSSKDFRRSKTLAYDQPQVMQIFDTWGGALAHDAYQEFSLKPMQKIVAGLIKEHQGRPVPAILFTKGGGQWLESLAATGANALGLDWTTPIKEARARVGHNVGLQGNMDPAILYSSCARIREEVGRILSDFGAGSGHVFNLGHGITPEVDPEHAGAFIRAVHDLSPQYHKS
jgi:uroporphyrinogen decarboxylase